jgi:lysophospholipase L1-like esterase
LHRSLASHIAGKLDQRGHLRVLFAGDSTMVGTADNGGIRLPTTLAFGAMGVPVRTVGELDDGAGTHRVMFDQCSGNTRHNAIGGLTTPQLTAGGTYSGRTISPFRSAVAALAPDLVVLATGTNDSGTTDERRAAFADLYAAVHAARPGTPVVHCLPFASNNPANDFYTFDTNRGATADAAMEAAAAANEDGLPVLCVDANTALSSGVRRPGAAFNSSTALANGVFLDGSHLHAEGYARIGCALVAAATGASCSDVVSALSQLPPFAPVPFRLATTITAAGQTTVVASGPRMHRMLWLRLRNGGASAATVTVQTLRNPGAASATVMSFALPAAESVNLAWESGSAPTAWFNEGWRLDVSGSGLSVEANVAGESVWA